VPLSALSAEKDQPYVWLVDPETATLKRTNVKIGAYGEKTVPVLEGLQANDWVVAAGGQVLREGQQVRPVDRDNRVVELSVMAKQTVKE
jgi:multidrug efflux system membrane fusion protein